jgi:hypothetical protein
MFDIMDGVMRVLAKKKTQWKKHLFFAVNFALQKPSKYYTEVTPTTGPITFTCFQPAIDSMYMISLVFGKYCLASSQFFIQLLLLDFHHVRQAI